MARTTSSVHRGIVGVIPARPDSHRSLWRRVRRRVQVPPVWFLPLYFLAVAPWLAALALTIATSPPWMQTVVQWLWLVIGLAPFVLPVFSLLLMRGRAGILPDVRRNLVLLAVGQGGTLA